MSDVPPDEIRAVIEKTAGFVVRNGESFEQRLLTKEANNPKFAFLRKDDVHHQYYQKCIRDLRSGEAKQPQKEAPEVPELRFIVSPGKVSALDVDMIKLAAQYVALNGDESIEVLKEHVSHDKKQSIQFEFLNASHSLHGLFEKYLESYKLILTEKEKIQHDVENYDQTEFLHRCYVRAQQMAKAEEEQTKEKQRLEKEQMEFASIDWQDFVVVETIEFTEVDEVAQLAPPLDRGELEYRSLLEKGEEAFSEEEEGESAENEEDEEVPVYEEQKEAVEPPKARPGMKIRSAGESRLKRKHEDQKFAEKTKNGERQVVCPLTGQLIPESKFGQHLAILLRDPKYKEEKQRYEAKMKYGDGLSTDEIYDNIKRLAEIDKRQKTQ
ncbi:hypothetical protein KL921_000344 [Ogataea angusta]|uniref:SURP motif domain-containing protein n=1 Tax=Pichia angusta TaxID=870730 RepID=A0AAN6DLE0_PICAN|nr:uncharacterized protein KL928_000447 [Ogataea angusta]KAG7814070.1 hypothetical protein KL921_000344 [Ogataea angusta]KAG7821972.1 hypothetical protein KL928_000447 [Ogataea angusta]KAG7825752.1 hypothetical protein KL909_000984 [Ogataea angusta]KAG7837263.1 hypothetical protein KL943_001302 [Ogataea angusta]KAG7864312.1 hypothetical protein KL919_000340 [Ogataea angusta]